jgi:hypothetical protein
MWYTKLQLLEMDHLEVLVIGARAARQALDIWPDEWATYWADLDHLVALLEGIMGLRPLTAPLPVCDPLALTERAFRAINRGNGPSRQAVLAVDAIRAAARAFYTFPAPDRYAVSDPTPEERKDRSVNQVYEALRLLEEIASQYPGLAVSW